jgi:hypothetical protein
MKKVACGAAKMLLVLLPEKIKQYGYHSIVSDDTVCADCMETAGVTT